MEIVSNLSELKAESSFTWKINDFNKIEWVKGYVIKSKEISLPEANSEWYIKLSPLICKDGIFLMTKFYVKATEYDENARFNFEIILKGKNAIQ
jgi:hypothetical protein